MPNTKGKKGRRHLQKSEAWMTAEHLYGELLAMDMVTPMFGEKPNDESLVAQLMDIIKTCPEFYPAWLDMGMRDLKAGRERTGVSNIEKGFDLMVIHGERKHLKDEIDDLIEKLYDLWRFDVSKPIIEKVIHLFPDKAIYHDMLAYASARTGDLDTAYTAIAKALDLAPENPFYLCNQGYYYLIGGALDKAEEALKRSLSYVPKDEVTKGNMGVLKYLRKRGGTFKDFLLRPVDTSELEKLRKGGKRKKLQDVCDAYNTDRIEALAQTLLHRGETSHLSSLLSTLRTFFGFVEELYEESDFLYEDIGELTEQFPKIMAEFMSRFDDVDEPMLESICDGLVRFYGYIADVGLARPSDVEVFRHRVNEQKARMISSLGSLPDPV